MNKLDRLDPEALLGNPRATLPAWKKYETLAMLAFKMHPQTYSWEPSNMAPSTVCTRLRDAVRGCLAFRHPISEIYEVTHEELARWFGEVVFKYDNDHVHVGMPQAVIHEIEGHAGQRDTPESNLVFPSLDFEELNAFVLLISKGRLHGPILVEKPPDITLLGERPNVELMSRKDGSLLIL